MSSTSRHSRSAGFKVPTSVTLRDGSVVRVNDCVYLNSISQGDFYQIARITQFLPSSKRDVKAEVAHFYRKCNTGSKWSPKDDPILLYATLSTEDIHTCHMVAKCTVTHLAFIHDLERYRRLENHFYFSQFYEKVLGQIYDVTPTLHVQNLPKDTLVKLRSMFSYVFAERGEVRKLKEPRRDCAVCKAWCEDFIRCMLCLEFYHGYCVTPPVTTRLTKGFDFQCSRCLTKAEVDFDDPKQIYGSSFRAKGAPRKSNGAEGDAVFTTLELKCTQNHPIRYLGRNITVAQALDPFASLHVRSPVPLGKDHQISPPPYVGPCAAERPRVASPPTGLQFGRAYPASRLIATEPTEAKRQGWLAQLEQLTPEELDCSKFGDAERSPYTLFRPENVRQAMKASQVWERLLGETFSIPSHSLEFGARAYEEMSACDLDGDRVVDGLKRLEPLDFGYFSHLAPGLDFEATLLKHGFDFDQVSQEFPPMDRAAAIQRFYAWKAEAVRQKERHGSTFDEKPSQLMAMVNPNEQDYTEEEAAETKHRRQRRSVPQAIKSCAHCCSKVESRWHPVPTFVTQKPELASIMCTPCANYLFRYAVPRPLLEPVLVPSKRAPARGNPRAAQDDVTDKASEGSSKRPRSHARPKPDAGSPASSVTSFTSASSESSSHPSSRAKRSRRASPGNSQLAARPRRRSAAASRTASRTASPTSDYGAIDPNNPNCRVCGSSGGLAVGACGGCGLRVHPGCYPGLVAPAPEPWSCDWCLNLNNKSASQSPRCVACGKVGSELKNQLGSMPLKPTAGNHWVHVVCLAFIDPLVMDVDDKVTGVADANCPPWSKACDLCPQSSGLTLQCKVCGSSAHALCAQAADYRMGFKVCPDQGGLVPWVACANHDAEPDFHPLAELDPDLNLTRIGVYLSVNKNKPKRDALHQPRGPFPFAALSPLAVSMCAPLQGWSRAACAPVAALACVECRSVSSPFWWNVHVDPNAPPSRVVETSAGPAHLEAFIYDPHHALRMCHACYWESRERQGAPVSPAYTHSSPQAPE
ncbi:putative PHD type zinc finger protein with BAH domain-containing protein [Massospora cicadina]|nr:putative PHD type zinc finger protein with BAH domain-containing protein [Massospora cicadina]